MEKSNVSIERTPAIFSYIKTLVVTLLFCALNFKGFSQAQRAAESEKFIFVKLSDPTKASFFRESIDAARMESYRLKSKRVVLHFENGFDIEMLSAKELYLKDNSILVANYPEEFPQGYQLPFFNILESGHLMAMYPRTAKP